MFGAAQARVRAQAFSELAAMIRAGVTIGEATSVVAEEMRPGRLRDALSQVGQEAFRGRSVAEAMRAHSEVFSPLTIAMVEVGERGGRLDESLREIADYHHRDFELRHLLTRELAYPLVLLAAIILIPVIGDFVRIWLTGTLQAALIAALSRLALVLVLLGVPAGLILLVISRMSRSRQGRLALDRLKIGLPIVGPAARKLAIARFHRALAALTSAGVMMGTAVRLAGEAAGNEAVRRDLARNAGQIDAGKSLSDALADSSLLPGSAKAMLRTGERTGAVDAMAEKVADYLEGEAETAIHQAAVSIMPVAVVIAGIIVAVMVISFYTGYVGELLQ